MYLKNINLFPLLSLRGLVLNQFDAACPRAVKPVDGSVYVEAYVEEKQASTEGFSVDGYETVDNRFGICPQTCNLGNLSTTANR